MDEQPVVASEFPWGYFAIAFGVSWLCWLPAVLATQRNVAWPFSPTVLVILGAHGPLVAAVSLTFCETGGAGVRRLLKQGFNIRLEFGWLLVILGLPLLLAGVALAVSIATGGPLPPLPLWARPWFIVPTFVVLFFAGGSVQEEFGWRGYALPRLLSRWQPFTASLILGILWGLWHLPLFYIAGVSQSYMPFGVFLVLAGAFSVVFTWFYLHTKQNLFSALLLHTMINLSLSLFPPIEQRVGGDQRTLVYTMVLYVGVAVVIVVAEHARWLSRMRSH